MMHEVPRRWGLPQVLTGMFSRTTGRIDDRWQAFMKFQIARARQCFADAEAGVDHLDSDARWPVWSALILYRCGLIASLETRLRRMSCMLHLGA